MPLALGGTSHWREIAIISHPADGITEISAEDLKSVFLGTKLSIKDSNRIRPVLMKGGPAHEVFLKEYLGKSDFALQTFYRSLVFSGQGMFPKTVGSDAEVISYVAKTRGAIGYIDAAAVNTSVKTLQVK